MHENRCAWTAESLVQHLCAETSCFLTQFSLESYPVSGLLALLWAIRGKLKMRQKSCTTVQHISVVFSLFLSWIHVYFAGKIVVF